MPGKPAQQDPAPYAPVIVAKSGRAIPQPHTADVFAILGIGCWVVAAVIGSCGLRLFRSCFQRLPNRGGSIRLGWVTPCL